MVKNSIYIYEENDRMYYKEINRKGKLVRKFTDFNETAIGTSLKYIFENKKLVNKTVDNGVKKLEFNDCIVHIHPEIENYKNNYSNKIIDDYVGEISKPIIEKAKYVKKNINKFISKVANKSVVKSALTLALSAVMVFPSQKKPEENTKSINYLNNDISVSTTNIVHSVEKEEVEEFLIDENNLVDKADYEFEHNELIQQKQDVENEYKQSIKVGNSFVESISGLNDHYERVVDTQDLRDDFDLGAGLDTANEKLLRSFLDTEESKYVFKYATIYGLDPYIVLAVAMNETRLMHTSTLPGGSRYNGYAWGIMQHETPSGREVTAYNYETNSYTTKYVTQENAYNIETNIELGVMMLQDVITRYNGNVLVALQAYNGGNGVSNIVISKFMYDYNISRDEVLKNIPINDFIDEFKKLSANASSYVSSLPNEVKSANQVTVNYLSKYTKYGTGNYIERVLSFYLGSEGVYKTLNEDNTISTKLYKYEEDLIEEYLHIENNNYIKVV